MDRCNLEVASPDGRLETRAARGGGLALGRRGRGGCWRGHATAGTEAERIVRGDAGEVRHDQVVLSSGPAEGGLNVLVPAGGGGARPDRHHRVTRGRGPPER